MQNDIEPRFPFGFGLSYTNFSYSGLHISTVHQSDKTSADLEAAWAQGEPSPNVEGGSVALWLHRPAFEVSFEVENSGSVAGGEVRPFFILNLTANAKMLTSCTDPAAVSALPVKRRRAAQRFAWVLRRAPQAAPERDCHAHAVAVRLERVGCGRAGLAEASWEVHVLRGREQPRLPLEGKHSGLIAKGLLSLPFGWKIDEQRKVTTRMR